MILETAQLLSGALRNLGCSHDFLYEDAHPSGHPCKTWTMATRDNFNWLVELGMELHDEWVWRGLRTVARNLV